MNDLIVFPTMPALRRWQNREAEAGGFADGRGHLSNAQFLGECAGAAQRAGLLAGGKGGALPPGGCASGKCPFS